MRALCLDEHARQAWADEQAQSGFGKQAAGTVKALNEAIAANKGLAEAREAWARSYGPAYEQYLRFKRDGSWLRCASSRMVMAYAHFPERAARCAG